MGQDNSSALALSQVEDFLREQAISKGRLVSLQTGDLLFEANDLSEELYLIKKGRIKVFIRNPTGVPVELAILQEGALIGEMSLFGEATRSASCAAFDQETELLAIPRSVALQLIEENPDSRHALIVLLSERSRNMVRFIHDFSNLTSLVADGNYTGVHALINSSGNPDPAVRSAREAFKLMLARVQEREAKLQSTVATLSLEIARQRASQEVESVMNTDLFKNLQSKAMNLRNAVKEQTSTKPPQT